MISVVWATVVWLAGLVVGMFVNQFSALRDIREARALADRLQADNEDLRIRYVALSQRQRLNAEHPKETK